jgi:hypothetical protein
MSCTYLSLYHWQTGEKMQRQIEGPKLAEPRMQQQEQQAELK